MTSKQRERAVAKAVVALEKAAEALSELASICIDEGVDTAIESRFRTELLERARYWDNCTWYKQDA